MKREIKIIIGILAILVTGLLSGCSGNVSLHQPEELAVNGTTKTEDILGYRTEGEATTTEETPQTAKVSLTIDFGAGDIKELEAEFKEELTVFDLLQEGAEQLGTSLQTKMYNIGVFIEIIGDKKNGQDNKYWTYYVNDEFANVAADKYELQAGDRVEWKFGESPF